MSVEAGYIFFTLFVCLFCFSNHLFLSSSNIFSYFFLFHFDSVFSFFFFFFQ